MGIQVEFNPDLALRDISEYKEGNRKIEECIPEKLEKDKVYDFLKRGQRLFWLNNDPFWGKGQLPLCKTTGKEDRHEFAQKLKDEGFPTLAKIYTRNRKAYSICRSVILSQSLRTSGAHSPTLRSYYKGELQAEKERRAKEYGPNCPNCKQCGLIARINRLKPVQIKEWKEYLQKKDCHEIAKLLKLKKKTKKNLPLIQWVFYLLEFVQSDKINNTYI